MAARTHKKSTVVLSEEERQAKSLKKNAVISFTCTALFLLGAIIMKGLQTKWVPLMILGAAISGVIGFLFLLWSYGNPDGYKDE